MRSLLFVLLGIAVLAFSADLFHMTYHLQKDNALWSVPGVGFKYAAKWFLVLVPLALLIGRKAWLRFLLLILMLMACQAPESLAFWSSGCKQAPQMMEKSGIARNAKESFFGRIKLQQPRADFFHYYAFIGLFPKKMDKITWWGKFKPFEFWQRPKFQAVWFDPSGKEVLKQEFKGNHCVLAKSTALAEQQPQGMFTPGVWKIKVTCDEYLVDQQTIAVLPTASIAENQKSSEMMIWAKDKV